MSSGYSPWIYRKFLYHIPGLFKKCPAGNYHPRWRNRICFCVDDCDLMDLKTGKKYVSLEKYERFCLEKYPPPTIKRRY
ncbi:MAG: hypothetical protein ABIL06_16170 [Pseudomonadota bacterium]